MDVGTRVTYLRQKKNMTTNKLANMAGISQSYLREVELGKKNPTVELLSLICDALNISLKDFFTEDKCVIQPFLLSAIEGLTEEQQLQLSKFINAMK